jgi:hypothetical protein
MQIIRAGKDIYRPGDILPRGAGRLRVISVNRKTSMFTEYLCQYIEDEKPEPPLVWWRRWLRKL